MKRKQKVILPLAVVFVLLAGAVGYDIYCNTSHPKDGSRDVIDHSPDARTAGYNGALPPDKHDIWPTKEFTLGTPASQKIRAGLLDWHMRLAKKETDSFAVLRRGALVYERYNGGMDADTPHFLASVTKGFISVLTGIAVKDGYIESPDQRVLDFYPEFQIAPGDEAKSGMTIQHLLTMTCGLEDTWYEDDDDPAAWWNAQDSGLAVLAQPLEAPPGEVYRYSMACYQLLGGVIARAAGKTVQEYAQEALFGPLGITSAEWDCAEDGSPFAAGGLSLGTHDMLRFGYLLLNEGRWEDREILSADWIAQSRAKNKRPNGVGRMFWNNRWNPGLDCYELRGAEGQFICVYPTLDMVVVRTGHGEHDYRIPLSFVQTWAGKLP